MSPESKQLNNQLAVNSVLELGRRLDRALADCQVSSTNENHNVNNQLCNFPPQSFLTSFFSQSTRPDGRSFSQSRPVSLATGVLSL
jgi:hypothetical protein